MKTSATTMKNIVLIGFMGCGKSTIGREIHHRLGYPLLELDQIIEDTLGKKITEIFREEGEAAFRDFETLQLIEISKQTDGNNIISTGGGIVIRADNRMYLRHLGFVVWLCAKEKVIFERTSRNRDRPLLNTPTARENISRLLVEREPWYKETAHLRIDTDGLDAHEVATGIIESARYFFGNTHE